MTLKIQFYTQSERLVERRCGKYQFYVVFIAFNRQICCENLKRLKGVDQFQQKKIMNFLFQGTLFHSYYGNSANFIVKIEFPVGKIDSRTKRSGFFSKYSKKKTRGKNYNKSNFQNVKQKSRKIFNQKINKTKSNSSKKILPKSNEINPIPSKDI